MLCVRINKEKRGGGETEAAGSSKLFAASSEEGSIGRFPKPSIGKIKIAPL